MRRSLIALAVLPLMATSAMAQEHREHSAHVHGEVELNLVVDADQLLIEITAPGADVVGFEHAPQNEAQTTALNQAMEKLQAGEQLFNFDAKCTLVDADITESLSGDDPGEHDHHGHHDDHEGHAHHDEHDSHDDHDHHDSHDDHEGHAHHDEDDSHGGHGEFSAQYTFDCEEISKLTEIELNWFTTFPATEKVRVQAITDNGQKAATLNASQHHFQF